MSDPIMGLVSTIIPVHNRPTLLKEAVGSVLEQTYRPIEIIIVDDGSTDDTPVVGSELASQHSDEVIFMKIPNGGPGVAREVGRQVARGEFIQYLDSDDLLLPHKFELQVAGLEKSPDCALSYGKTREYIIGKKPQNVAARRTGEMHEKIFPAALGGRFWTTESPLYRRSSLDCIGSWSDLRILEDWEYECRLGAYNVAVHFCDEFVSDHRHHSHAREGLLWQKDDARFRDLLAAHELVLEYARKAGIEDTAPEIRLFARNLFRLARVAGARGIIDYAGRLLKLGEKIDSGSRWEYRLYRWSVAIVGWQRASVWGERFAGRRRLNSDSF